MSNEVRIPMFPLAILPMPGELVPLHIFEPRYRQLLQDLETSDITFGIYFSHEVNTLKLGSLMRLESVIKRYPTGESDIIVKCEDILTVDLLLRTYKDKLYPGGDVKLWKLNQNNVPTQDLYDAFSEYMKLRNISNPVTPYNIYDIANELNLDVNDRYKFLTSDESLKDKFVKNRVKFQIHLLHQEDKSRDVYHLN
jgi:uncharacterized protein